MSKLQELGMGTVDFCENAAGLRCGSKTYASFTKATSAENFSCADFFCPVRTTLKLSLCITTNSWTTEVGLTVFILFLYRDTSKAWDGFCRKSVSTVYTISFSSKFFALMFVMDFSFEWLLLLSGFLNNSHLLRLGVKNIRSLLLQRMQYFLWMLLLFEPFCMRRSTAEPHSKTSTRNEQRRSNTVHSVSLRSIKSQCSVASLSRGVAQNPAQRHMSDSSFKTGDCGRSVSRDILMTSRWAVLSTRRNWPVRLLSFSCPTICKRL